MVYLDEQVTAAAWIRTGSPPIKVNSSSTGDRMMSLTSDQSKDRNDEDDRLEAA
jgi:hypothetical protein